MEVSPLGFVALNGPSIFSSVVLSFSFPQAVFTHLVSLLKSLKEVKTTCQSSILTFAGFADIYGSKIVYLNIARKHKHTHTLPGKGLTADHLLRESIDKVWSLLDLLCRTCAGLPCTHLAVNVPVPPSRSHWAGRTPLREGSRFIAAPFCEFLQRASQI